MARRITQAWIAGAMAAALLCVGCGKGGDEAPAGRAPSLAPDYAGLVVPPNIAPLNFRVTEPGRRYRARLFGTSGEPIELQSGDGSFRIPAGKWSRLLEANRGGEIAVEIRVLSEAGWTLFEPVTNAVSADEIDRGIAYRQLTPGYTLWRDIGIYWRDLTGFTETPILESADCDSACLNCHTFASNGGDCMAVSFRSSRHGSATLFVEGDTVTRLETKTGYASWHPSGQVYACSLNKVRQFFHTVRDEPRDVFDLDSDIVYHIRGTAEFRTAPALSERDRMEAYPAWSADGAFLYYSSAPILWDDRESAPPERYAEVRYDLMRVSYDAAADQWGDAEVVLSAEETGKSLVLVRPSPDGRFLLFCMADYGYFPVFQPSSDLYLMDLASGEHWACEGNSPESESWHSWSSNGRWVAFSSKRDDGVYTRTYLAHIDEAGVMSKPFALPQADPEHDASFVRTYSVPELLTGPPELSAARIAEEITGGKGQETSMPAISMTAKPGATPEAEAYAPSEPAEPGR